MKNNKLLQSAIIFASVLTLPSLSWAKPAGADQIHLTTSAPKKTGDAAFSYMVEWRRGSDVTHRANGLTFISGPGSKKPTTDVAAAKKIAKALNDAMTYESPHDRGATAVAIKGKPEVLIANKDGFDFTRVTFRDYSNQELKYSVPGSFSSATKGVAIDIVYAADVEYIEGFSIGVERKTNGGHIRVQINGDEPVEIITDGKTTQQIEQELAKALAGKAQVSTTPIYPNYVESGSRNYKPFDGSEVQLTSLNTDSIIVDINDTGLGVLTKFKFPDVNKPTDVAGKMPYFVGVLVVAAIGYFFYTSRKIKEQEQQDQA